MRLLDLQGKVYNADIAVKVAESLQEAELDGWKYVAEIKESFGRVKAFDAEGNFAGYF